MLDTTKIIELTEQAARKWIAFERVLVEPMVDSQGDEALRITLVIEPDVIERTSGDQTLHALVAIKRAIRAAGDERLPIVYYATEQDLVAEDVQ